MFNRRIAVSTALAASLAFCSTLASADDGESGIYADQSIVQVSVESIRDLRLLQAVSESILNCNVGIGPMDAIVTQDGLAALKASGVAIEVLEADVQAFVTAERERIEQANVQAGVGDAWYADFKNFDQIIAHLDELRDANPTLMQKHQIGSSLEGRPIWAYRMTIPSGVIETKPMIFFNGGQHAREWINPMTATYIAEQLVTRAADGDPDVVSLFEAFEFAIVPVVNPDGYIYSWTDERFWRKNRRDNQNGTWGVDLNRNWSAGWGGPGSDGETDSETYRGTFPFSEPETQALRDFFLANPQIVAHIDFHSYSQLVLWPYGYAEEVPTGPEGEVVADLGTLMADTIASVSGATYDAQPAHELYLASGICTDWVFDVAGALAWTIELRPSSNAGGGFAPPPSQILPTAQENFEAFKAMSSALLVGVDFAFPQGVPETLPVATPREISLTVTPISSGPLDMDSGELRWRTSEEGPFTVAPMTSPAENEFIGTIPEIECGESIEYYFVVQSMNGEQYRSPAGAPATTYSAEAIPVEVAFDDDFETDLGWNASSAGGLGDGGWERGVPIPNSTCDRGNPGADYDGSGQCFLTDNSAANDCNSDVDGGSAVLTSPVMDATVPGAVLSYARWYSNDFGAAPFSDEMIVEVSDDGGLNWTTLEVVGPGGPEVSGGWFAKSFAIADIPEVAGTDQFMVRFIVGDLGDGSVIEAAVDAVRIEAIGECPDDGTPGDFDDNGIVDVLDLLQMLGAWGACPAEGPCVEDLNDDGTVGVLDLLELLGNWG